jgi:alpha-tubulin suppressor-like RCC1 family protein
MQMPPTPILLNSTYGPPIQIGCGADFTCALFQQGAVACWGDNTFGQLGIDSAVTSVSEMPPEFVPWNLTTPGTSPSF